MDKQFKSVQEMIKWLEEHEFEAIGAGSESNFIKYREIIMALNDLSTRMQGDYLEALCSTDPADLEHVNKMFEKYYGP